MIFMRNMKNRVMNIVFRNQIIIPLCQIKVRAKVPRISLTVTKSSKYKRQESETKLKGSRKVEKSQVSSIKIIRKTSVRLNS